MYFGKQLCLISLSLALSCNNAPKKSETESISSADKLDIMQNKNSFEKYTADYIQIRQLIDEYNDLVNLRRWQSIDDIFTEDAVWEAMSPVNMKWTGLDDIKEKLPASVERMEVIIQSSSGVVINVENPSLATARSLLTEFGRNKETSQGMHSVATYEDTLVKVNDRWRIKSRKLTLLYNDTLPVPGNVKDYKY
jgi:ketosteroid isomerase-like protein